MIWNLLSSWVKVVYVLLALLRSIGVPATCPCAARSSAWRSQRAAILVLRAAILVLRAAPVVHAWNSSGGRSPRCALAAQYIYATATMYVGWEAVLWQTLIFNTFVGLLIFRASLCSGSQHYFFAFPTLKGCGCEAIAGEIHNNTDIYIDDALLHFNAKR